MSKNKKKKSKVKGARSSLIRDLWSGKYSQQVIVDQKRNEDKYKARKKVDIDEEE